MIVLVTLKNKDDPIKNEGARVFKHFSCCKYMGIFSDAQGQLTPIRLNFELSPDFMGVLVTCKKKEDSNENKGARVFTTLYINLPTLKSS